MNKKNIVTKTNIDKVATFLKESADYFKNQGEGCCHFNLSEDLALYVGWSDGYDMADTDIIKSIEGQRPNGSWTCGYAVNAAVKVRNDFDCADFDFLDYPYYPNDGECWDNGISLRPNQTRRDYKRDARWFLETFVSMTNAHKKGEIVYE
jgi:hypothetical protein